MEEEITYKNESILVVDDEKDVRETVVEMLTNLGFQVRSVSNAQEALQELDKGECGFVLTDIKMPGMDGLELIRQIKTSYPDVCSIAMTGYSQEYGYVDVIDAGAADFLDKPFGIEELEAKVKRVMIERNIKRELGKLSITDSLTGLYNRRHFFTRLNEELMRAERQQQELALIFLDLDDFKRYNDTYGHLSGDSLLQKVGKIINANIRQGVDSGYRYGGDEFAIILVEADEALAHKIGRRIQKAIEEQCKLGASIGYASLGGLSANEILARADESLYEAKRHKKRIKKDIQK